MRSNILIPDVNPGTHAKNIASEQLLPIMSERLLCTVSNSDSIQQLGSTCPAPLLSIALIFSTIMLFVQVSCPGNFLSDEHGPRFV